MIQQKADYSMTCAQTMMLKNEIVKGLKFDNQMKAADIGLISECTQGAKYENQFLADTYSDRVASIASNLTTF
jgi:hypothetical protein